MSSVIERESRLSAERRREVGLRVFGRRRAARCKRTLRVGSPGSWKSGASEVEACEWWLPPFEKRGLLVIDPHGDTVKSLARRFWAKGRGRRVVLDELRETRRVPAYKVFGDVAGEGFAGELKVHDEVMRQVEILADERGHMERINLHPFVRQWLYWPIRAVIRDREPMRSILKTYNVLSDQSRAIVEASGDPAVRQAFDDLRALPRMEIERQMGASRRIVQSYAVGHVRERSGDWDWFKFLDDGGALLIDASDVAQETSRPFDMNIVLRAISGARARRTPLLIIIDEANRGFTSSHMLADQLEQLSKYLIGITFCCQAPDFPKEVEKRYWQSMSRTEVFGSSAEVLKDMFPQLWPLIDFHREHHRDVSWQQFHDGFDELEKRRKSQTTGKTKYGGEHPHASESASSTESTETIVRPRYREFANERISYMSANDQLIEQAVRIMQLEPGERLVLERGHAWWDTVPWLDRPFPRAVERTYEKRFQEFLDEMRSRDCFRTPQAEAEPIRIGAACRLQKLRAGHNGHSNGSNGTARK